VLPELVHMTKVKKELYYLKMFPEVDVDVNLDVVPILNHHENINPKNMVVANIRKLKANHHANIKNLSAKQPVNTDVRYN
jgi:hypothetical protein